MQREHAKQYPQTKAAAVCYHHAGNVGRASTAAEVSDAMSAHMTRTGAASIQVTCLRAVVENFSALQSHPQTP